MKLRWQREEWLRELREGGEAEGVVSFSEHKQEAASRLPFKNVLILTRQFRVACVPGLCVCVCPVCVLCFVVPCLMMVSIAKAFGSAATASDINANKLRQFLAMFLAAFWFFFSDLAKGLQP